jgi:hypothetical protein
MLLGVQETRAIEAETALAEQETKSKQLVEVVRKQKSEWEQVRGFDIEYPCTRGAYR